MWRLTINRTTERMLGERMTEFYDYMVYESDELSDIHYLINFTNKRGVGKFKYEIEFVAKGGEEEC